MLKPLTLQTITEMDDGRIAEAVRLALKRCEEDCRDRPGLKDKRKATITITMTPQMDEEGRDVETVDFWVDIKETIPQRKSKVYNALARGHGLFINEVSDDDARQLTLDETGESEKGGPRANVS